ncbi:MAG: hypothetical protein Q8L55_15390 [Phycisphaerales bacterium]|nr:hypothetical protein [Phycisphaerales bacterium]
MTVPIAVILSCILTGLAACFGIAVQMLRHGTRQMLGWLWLPIGALLTFAFIPASIGYAEGVWTGGAGWGDWRLWTTLSLGLLGLLGQFMGWHHILRPRLRKSQCPACEYEVGALPRCPECGHVLRP